MAWPAQEWARADVAAEKAADDNAAVEAAGRAAIQALDWDEALRVYAPLAAAAKPGSALWTRATFCLAVARQHNQPASAKTIAEAQRLYQSIIDQSADEKYVARALMNLGRIAELKDFSDDKIDLDTARKYYGQVMERFAADPIASEAALREGAAFVLEFDAPSFAKARQGPAVIEKWLAAHPNDALASPMWQIAGDAYFNVLEDWKNALRCYEKVDALGWTDAGNQGPWYWRSAQIAESLKDPATAIKYYTKIISETPNSGKGFPAVLALKRLGAPVPANPMFDDPTTRPAPQTASATSPSAADGSKATSSPASPATQEARR